MATQSASSSVYIWSGTDKSGNKSKGEITGTTQANAKALLRKQGIVAKSVKKKPKPLFGERGKAIKAMDISIFNVERMRDKQRAADSELPPNSKKLLLILILLISYP